MTKDEKLLSVFNMIAYIIYRDPTVAHSLKQELADSIEGLREELKNE